MTALIIILSIYGYLIISGLIGRQFYTKYQWALYHSSGNYKIARAGRIAGAYGYGLCWPLVLPVAVTMTGAKTARERDQALQAQNDRLNNRIAELERQNGIR